MEIFIKILQMLMFTLFIIFAIMAFLLNIKLNQESLNTPSLTPDNRFNLKLFKDIKSGKYDNKSKNNNQFLDFKIKINLIHNYFKLAFILLVTVIMVYCAIGVIKGVKNRLNGPAGDIESIK